MKTFHGEGEAENLWFLEVFSLFLFLGSCGEGKPDLVLPILLVMSIYQKQIVFCFIIGNLHLRLLVTPVIYIYI